MRGNIFRSSLKELGLIFYITISISIFLYLALARNAWYAEFFKLIINKDSVFNQILKFLAIVLLIVINDVVKSILKVHFISRQRKNARFTQENYFDSAQRISEDGRLWPEKFIYSFDDFFSGIFLVIIFVCRLFLILEKKAEMVATIMICYSSLIFVLNFGYIKNLIQVNLYKYEEKEAKFRRFLSSWFSKKCLKPVEFNDEFFEQARKSMRANYFVRIFVDFLRSIYDNVGLILPFMVFGWLRYGGFVSFPKLMQLINLWTQIHYGIILISKGLESFVAASVNYQRFQSNFDRKKRVEISDAFKFDNVTIVGRKGVIIKNFDLELQPFDRVNIVLPNRSGKTTLMQAMQGFIQYDGSIRVPKRILWIPEDPIFPEKTHFPKNSMFIKACKFMEVGSDLLFDSASGSEKWKLIAAYALSGDFDYIVWDDPFWGLDASLYLKKFLEKFRGGILIFSTTPIDKLQRLDNLKGFSTPNQALQS